MLNIYYKTKNRQKISYRFCNEVFSCTICNDLTTGTKNLIDSAGTSINSCTQKATGKPFLTKKGSYQGLIGIISSGN